MESIAKYKNISLSPRKAKLIIDVVRSKLAMSAMGILKHMPQKAALHVAHVLRSAMGNMSFLTAKEGGEGSKKSQGVAWDSVYVKEIYVTQGSVLKRVKPCAKGVAHPIRKPKCHIFVKLEWRQEVAATTKSEKKEQPAN